MTTWPSNQSRDQWAAATTAAYIPQTVSMRAAAGFDATPTAARQSYVTGFACSAEQPEYAYSRSPSSQRDTGSRVRLR